MDFIWLVTWLGFKRFWKKKGYTSSKIVYWLSSFFITKTINQVLLGAVYVLAEITFLFYLRVIHIFFFEFLFFLFLIRELLMCPFFTLFFIFIFFRDLLSWTEFKHADNPCLGYFWKKFSIFQAQRGCNGILLMFQDEQTWSYIILNYDCLIFREINFRNRFKRFPILVIFLFSSSYLLLRSPFVGFQSNRLLFLFLFFFNAFSEKNLRFTAIWKI